MFYAIHAIDNDNSLDKRLQERTEHRKRLTDLQDQGRLLTAGPFPAVDSSDPGPAGFSGSLIVAEFSSLEDAKTWANDDPYMQNGVYASVDVRPFLNVFS